MNDIFALWELRERMSTMQQLEDERNKLLRGQYISRVVALAVWIGAAWIAAWQVGVWVAGKI